MIPGSRAEWPMNASGPYGTSSGKRPSTALTSVPTSPGRSGAVAWPAGLSTITICSVSRTIFSGAPGLPTAGTSATCATSMRTSSPSESVPPLGMRRPLTRTAPSSIARLIRARLSSGRSCAIPLSSRAPWSDAGTTNARTAFSERPRGSGLSFVHRRQGTIVTTRPRPSPLMLSRGFRSEHGRPGPSDA